METSQVSFKQIVSRGCGIDVHKKVVVATIDGEGIKKQTGIWHYYMFFERIERLVIGKRDNPCGYGKYGCFLEACIQCFGTG